MPAVGTPAPDFTVPGTDGTDAGRRDYTLSAYRGQPVVLAFYPGDNTPVCTRQLNAYTAEIDEFAEVGAQLLAISPQDVASHEDFADKQGGFGFPLLADTDKAVGEAYGVIGPIGFYRRSVFVIDAQGMVAYSHRAIAGLTFRPTTELVEAVARSKSA
ncbi:peroxiredoxin [Actinospongicola halichondriae]|uniref:peroxiredoxin n=1 Tax=Actinospongicola halichondriae TaxID=3236844 RepID=UPI003D4AC82D